MSRKAVKDDDHYVKIGAKTYREIYISRTERTFIEVKPRFCKVCGKKPGDGFYTFCSQEHMFQGRP